MKERKFWNVLKNYKKRSIFYKYLLTSVAIILIPAIIMGYLFLYYNKTEQNKTLASELEQINKNICENTESIFKTVNNGYSELVSNEKLLYYLYNENYTNQNTLFTDVTDIPQSIRRIMNTAPYIHSIKNPLLHIFLLIIHFYIL